MARRHAGYYGALAASRINPTEPMTRWFTRPALLPALLCLVLLAAGCRTYGGYDSGPLTMAQIEEANRTFAAEAERARAELGALERLAAGSADSLLVQTVQAYGALVTLHEALLAEHRQEAEEADRGNYRALSRTLGAIVSEQALVRDGYARLANRLAAASRGGSPSGAAADTAAVAEAPLAVVPLRSRYVVAPSFYARRAHAVTATPTLSEAAARYSGRAGALPPAPSDTAAADTAPSDTAAAPAATAPADTATVE